MKNHDSRGRATAIFQTLAADGAAASEDQRTLPRRLLMVLAIGLVTFAPLLWAMAAQGASSDAPEAVLSGKQAGAAADDDDDDDTGSGSGAGGTNSNAGTGRETQGNTDRGGQDTGKSTVGETDGRDGTGATEQTEGTGRETQGNTDRGGQDTGVSTVGETDGRDGTGATEQTEGTGRETRGDSDDRGDTGVKTAGDTDGDGTDSNRANGTDTAGGGNDT